jgi:hypothetical protein
LNLIARQDCKVMTIRLNKQKVYTKPQDEKPVLYNYAANFLLDRIFSKKLLPESKDFEIIASRKETNRFLNQNFKMYLKSQAAQKHGVSVRVVIRTPSQEKCLQAVDFISWAAFRKYERGDCGYYDIIKSKIIEDNLLFP